MKKLIFIAITIFLFSCNSSRNSEALEQRIKTLELQVDSLQQAIKTMASTDSILIEEVFKPEKGSLLEEIDKMK